MRVLDPNTLGFADFAGNRQYITLGNLGEDPRVSLFLMDYARRSRMKIFGRVEIVDPEDAAMLSMLEMPGGRDQIERGLLIRIEAFDWNCPKHITPRFTQAEIAVAVKPLQARIAELEHWLGTANDPT